MGMCLDLFLYWKALEFVRLETTEFVSKVLCDPSPTKKGDKEKLEVDSRHRERLVCFLSDEICRGLIHIFKKAIL